jgi:small-conductance mechanosensitive channel
MVRRLVFALIVGAGLFIALLQFESFDRFASAALASGALISAIVGFAARDSLGNALAGIVLAITQPVRFGDVVTIGDARGTVEDVTLTATWLRTADGSRLIVPNQLVTTSVVRNETIGGEAVAPSASIWIAPLADARSALSALAAIPGADGSSIEETAPGGTRLSVSGPPVPAVERATAESQLRSAAHEALRAAGIDRAGAA